MLVEVKRAVDTRLRREVVGQLLDYAANGAAHWTASDLAQSFASRCAGEGMSPDEALNAFLDGGAEAEGFWERVESNLRDGRLRLLIVADRIPPELARIVEFLNEQMRADVLAVELRYFEAADGRLTLAPRVIGETETLKAHKKVAAKPLISVAEWLDAKVGPLGTPARDGAEAWLSIVSGLGARVGVTPAQASIFTEIATTEGKTAYPLYLRDPSKCEICFLYNHKRGRLAEEAVRMSVLRTFESAVGQLSTDKLTGWPAFPLERLTDDAIASAFRDAAQEWLSLCRDPWAET